MGLRTTISERQRRLGVELKQLREQAGLSAADAAQRIRMSRTQLSHIELGRTSILTERLLELCHTYGCMDEPYIDALVSMSEATGKGWWSGYRKRRGPGALNLAEMEANAVALRTHQSLFIPGLFQTAEYARAIFASPALGVDDIEEALEFRLARQRVLTGGSPPAVHAVIHEAALHLRFGSSQTVREQLLHLIELARLPHVTIQVYPFTAQAYSALSGNFVHLIPENPRLGTVVLEQPTGDQYLTEPERLEQYGAFRAPG